MHISQGWPHLSCRKRCSKAEAGGYETGGRLEEGEESAVDGIAAGAGMGTEGEMSLAPLLDRPSVSSNQTFFGRHSDQQENKNDCDIKTFYVGRN